MFAETSSVFAGDLATSLWTIAVFVVLVLVLRRFAWKPILDGLQKREHQIKAWSRDKKLALISSNKSALHELSKSHD